MPCAGLESMTQVFSVISSCIVDESVGRCNPCSHTPISLALWHNRLLMAPHLPCRAGQVHNLRHGLAQAQTAVQLFLGHAKALP